MKEFSAPTVRSMFQGVHFLRTRKNFTVKTQTRGLGQELELIICYKQDTVIRSYGKQQQPPILMTANATPIYSQVFIYFLIGVTLQQGNYNNYIVLRFSWSHDHSM